MIVWSHRERMKACSNDSMNLFGQQGVELKNVVQGRFLAAFYRNAKRPRSFFLNRDCVPLA